MCLSPKINIIQNFAKFKIFEQIKKNNQPKHIPNMSSFHVPRQNKIHQGIAEISSVKLPSIITLSSQITAGILKKIAKNFIFLDIKKYV